MDVRFEFPEEVKRFAKREGIMLDDVKRKIRFYLDVDLVDGKYRPIKCDKIRIVVHGLQKSHKNKIILDQRKRSKKKLLTAVSSNMLLKGCSVYYVIYRDK